MGACNSFCECDDKDASLIEKLPENPTTCEHLVNIPDSILLSSAPHCTTATRHDDGNIDQKSTTYESLQKMSTHETGDVDSPQLRGTTIARSQEVVARANGRNSECGPSQNVIPGDNTQETSLSGNPEVTTEGSSNPAAIEFPTATELIKQVLDITQIFNVAKHDVCAFGSIGTSNKKSSVLVEGEYSEKKLEFSGARSDDTLRTALAKSGIGMCCKKARKPGTPNQDNVFVCKIGNFTFCGVADGHGPHGHWCSHWVVRYVLRLLMAEMGRSGTSPGDLVLKQAFALAHASLEEHSKSDGFDTQLSGTTLSICIVDHCKKHVVVAWVGDSRCSFGMRGGTSGSDLTHDHKPDLAEEKKRIEAEGGQVLKDDDEISHRVFMKGADTPGLAMSRSLGDTLAKTLGVTCDPDILRYKADNCFVLCCSDGVWEFMDSVETASLVGERGRDDVRYAVEFITREARSRWIDECDATDDISAICVYV